MSFKTQIRVTFFHFNSIGNCFDDINENKFNQIL